MNTNKQQATETRIVALAPGMYIVRFNAVPGLEEGAILSIAPGDSGVKFDFLASEGVTNNTLSNQSDCIVVRCMGGEGNILITSLCRKGSLPVGTRVDRIGGADERPVAEPASHQQPRLAQAPAPRELVNLGGHVEMEGDVKAPAGQWLGDPSSSRRLEGFSVDWVDRPADVDLAYSCVIAGIGRSPALLSGGYCGTRQRAASITALTASLVGKKADAYQLQMEAVFAGCPQQKVSDGVECRGVTGREQLVALRAAILQKHQD